MEPTYPQAVWNKTVGTQRAEFVGLNCETVRQEIEDTLSNMGCDDERRASVDRQLAAQDGKTFRVVIDRSKGPVLLNVEYLPEAPEVAVLARRPAA